MFYFSYDEICFQGNNERGCSLWKIKNKYGNNYIMLNNCLFCAHQRSLILLFTSTERRTDRMRLVCVYMGQVVWVRKEDLTQNFIKPLIHCDLCQVCFTCVVCVHSLYFKTVFIQKKQSKLQINDKKNILYERLLFLYSSSSGTGPLHDRISEYQTSSVEQFLRTQRI